MTHFSKLLEQAKSSGQATSFDSRCRLKEQFEMVADPRNQFGAKNPANFNELPGCCLLVPDRASAKSTT
jgi:hypothetical protein